MESEIIQTMYVFTMFLWCFWSFTATDPHCMEDISSDILLNI